MFGQALKEKKRKKKKTTFRGCCQLRHIWMNEVMTRKQFQSCEWEDRDKYRKEIKI